MAIGSIRSGGELYMLSYAGRSADGEHVHVLHQVDEDAPQYRELPPTPVDLDPVRLEAAEREARQKLSGGAPQDDGSIHDLLVVYSQRAVDEVGGLVAMENLIDLGVTETNLSGLHLPTRAGPYPIRKASTHLARARLALHLQLRIHGSGQRVPHHHGSRQWGMPERLSAAARLVQSGRRRSGERRAHGSSETDPLPADMRKALNATGWTVANFRVSNSVIFADGFESGDLTAWGLNP